MLLDCLPKRRCRFDARTQPCKFNFINRYLVLLLSVAAVSQLQAAQVKNDSVSTPLNTAISIPVLANDKDNHLDALFTQDVGPNQLCLGDGQGGFLSCQPIINSADSINIALGDVNHDNQIDAIFANNGRENQICFGNGQGGFSSCQTVEGAYYTFAAALADLNRDGAADIVFANSNYESDRFCLGNGAGDFRCQDIPGTVETNSKDVAVADLNNDGWSDIIFAHEGAANQVCLNSNMVFSCEPIDGTNFDSWGIALNDWDQDGVIDVIFAHLSAADQRCLGLGNGKFASCIDVNEPADSYDVASADIDNNGVVDVIFAHEFASNTLCVNNMPCQPLNMTVNDSYGIALADINNDNQLDISFANQNAIETCLNQGNASFTCTQLNHAATKIAWAILGLDKTTLILNTLPEQGTAHIDNASGNIIYTPKTGFSGIDSLTYKIEGVEAQVTIEVSSEPEAVKTVQEHSNSAIFDPPLAPTLNLSVSLAGNGSGQVHSTPVGIDCHPEDATCAYRFASATWVTLQPTAAPGSEFKGWINNEQCAGAQTASVLLTQNLHCTAYFELAPRTLTVNIKGQGHLLSEPYGIECQQGICSHAFKANTSVYLTPIAAPGWHFVNWNGDCTPDQAVVLDKHKHCQAVFEKMLTDSVAATPQSYYVAIGKQGNGDGTIEVQVINADGSLSDWDTHPQVNCSATAPGISCWVNNQELKLKVLPQAAPHSEFIQFEGGCNQAGEIAFSTPSDKVCTVFFEKTWARLTVNRQGQGQIISTPAGLNCDHDSCVHLFAADKLVQLTAQPAAHWQFSHWLGDCTQTGTVTLFKDSSCQAIFLPEHVTVTIEKSAGGVVSSTSGVLNCGSQCSATYPAHSQLNLTATPEASFKFIHWQGDCQGDEPNLTLNLAYHNVNCQAVFKPQYGLSLTRQGQGQVKVNSAVTCVEPSCHYVFLPDEQVTLEAIPAAQWRFKAWAGQCQGNTATTSLNITADQNCQAIFEPQSTFFLLTDTLGQGRIFSQGIHCGACPDCNDCIEIFNQKTEITLGAEAENSSEFVRWQGDCQGQDNPIQLTVDQAKSCQALFQLKTFTLEVDTGGRGQGSVQITLDSCSGNCNGSEYSYGSQLTLVAQPATGAKFAQWRGVSDVQSNQPTIQLTMETDKYLKAYFELVDGYELTINKLGQGIVRSTPETTIFCGEQCQQTFRVNETLQLTAQPAPGWRFDSWGANCQDGQVKMTTNQVCDVTFEPILRLSVTQAGSGQGHISSEPAGLTECSAQCLQEYTEKTQVTLTATPQPGARFSHWQGDCSSQEPTVTIWVDQIKHCIAHFEALPVYTLTITPASQGQVNSLTAAIQCGDQCTSEVAGSVTLIAQAEEGWQFDHWSGDCQGTQATLTVDMEADKTCQAHYVAAVFSLTVEVEGVGTLTSQPSGIVCHQHTSECVFDYQHGTEVHLNFEDQDHEHFVALWRGDCDDQGRVLMDAPKQCQVRLQCLANGLGIGNPLGLPINTQSCFSGHIMTSAGEQPNHVRLSPESAQNLDLSATITPDPAHVGQPSDLYVALIHKYGGQERYYLPHQGQWHEIDEPFVQAINNEAHIVKHYEQLPEHFEFPLYTGDFFSHKPGDAQIYVAYRITHQDLLPVGETHGFFYNGQQPIHFSVEADEPSNACLPNGMGIDFWGNTVSNQACFNSTLATGSTVQPNHAQLSQTEAQAVTLSTVIQPDIEHVGRPARLLIGLIHQTAEQQHYYRLQQGQWQRLSTDWLSSFMTAPAVQTFEALPEQFKVIFFKGDLSAMPGAFKVYIGYLTQGDFPWDSAFFFNGQQPIAFTVADKLRLTVEVIGSGVIKSEPEGILCPDHCRYEYPQDTTVQLSLMNDLIASPTQQLTWSGDCDAQGRVIMNTARFCQATITRVQSCQANGIGVAIDGHPIEQSDSCFNETLATAEGIHANHVILSPQAAQQIRLSASITLDTHHVGQPAELFMIGHYQPAHSAEAHDVMRVAHSWQPWNGDYSQLQAAQSYEALPEKIENLVIYEGDLSQSPGEFTVHIGYHLQDSSAFYYNGDSPIHFFVNSSNALTCMLYGVHDEGQNNSQFFSIDPTTLTVTQLGEVYSGFDIEALDINAQGELYAASSSHAQFNPNYLYQFNSAGQLEPIDAIGFEDVDSLAFDTQGVLWGWARGQGLIQIDMNTGKGQLVVPSTVDVEDMSWGAADQLLSVVTDEALLFYRDEVLVNECPLWQPVEGLEFITPQLLLATVHGDNQIYVIDSTHQCAVVATLATPYDDIEGIACQWPSF